MAFYEENQSGNFLPYIGFNAKSDKWFINVNKEKVPVKGNFSFVADFKNLKTGWFLFQDGMAPNVLLDASLTEKAVQPTPKHKRGVKISFLLKGDHPGVYEFSTVAGNVLKPLSQLHDQYLAEIEKNPDNLPVIKVGDSVEVKSSFKNPDGTQGTATNYMPVFTIEKFIPRLKEFDADAQSAPTTTPAAQKMAAIESEF